MVLSYAREDIGRAELVRRWLSARGLAVWVDWERVEPGSFWRPQVEKAIEASISVGLVLSPASLRSQNCLSELVHAQRCDKPVIGFRPELVDQPGGSPVCSVRYAVVRVDVSFGESMSPQPSGR